MIFGTESCDSYLTILGSLFQEAKKRALYSTVTNTCCCCCCCCCCYLLSSPKDMLIDFKERGREGQREAEKH